MENIKTAYLQGYEQMAQERFAIGWNAYLLTFMFNPLPGGQARKLAAMQEEVSATYHKISTRMYRNPKKVETRYKPLWIIAPDLPVAKYNKGSTLDAIINDGLHFHAIALLPPENPRRFDIELCLSNHPEKFSGSNRYLHRINIERIESDADYVSEYALKSVRRGKFESDNILILPPASSERPNRTREERMQAKLDGLNRRLYLPRR